MLFLGTGCGLTEKRQSFLDETGNHPSQTCAARAGIAKGKSVATSHSAGRTPATDSSSAQDTQAVEDPEWLIEQANTLCDESNYAAADSTLKRAVKSIEIIEAENEGNEEWFPSSQYLDEIVAMYTTRMPPQFSVPEDIALTAFQRQMGRSLDSMKLMPAESLAIAGAECQRGITYDVPMVWNDRVQRALIFYVKNRKVTIDRWFYRASYYLPVMRKMFADSGLPQDLAYLPLIESGFNPLAYSYAHASGVWQFISSTGKLYGLRHNYWLDERRDPIKSTVAAIAYLKKLYGDFGHWHLALAAYNCGENGVSRSIARCQHNDFWRLKLPEQTKCYVPFYLAAVTIAKNPKRFAVDMPATINTFALDTVHVSDCINMGDIAQGIGVPLDTLKKINPQILHWCTPPDVTETVLYLPKGQSGAFRDFYAQLPPEKRVKWCRYQIKPGDNIRKIAQQFHITADGIRAINRLKKDRMAAGHFLFLPLPGSTSDSTVAYLPPISASADEDALNDITQYVVRRGDSMGKIAHKFHVTCAQLYRWNHLSAKSCLRPGRSLIVRFAPAPEPEPLISAAAPGGDSLKAGGTHIVRKGDTPFSIAARAGIKLGDLIAWNNLDPKTPAVRLGDTLRLGRPAAAEPPASPAKTEGSAPPALDSAAAHDVKGAAAPSGDWASALSDEKPADSAGTKSDPKTSRSYIVKPGDNLFRIAQACAVSLQALLAFNHLNANSVVHPGDSLHVPPDASAMALPHRDVVYYKVKEGDTLRQIAATFGISLDELYKYNNLQPDSALVPGEVIRVIKAGTM